MEAARVMIVEDEAITAMATGAMLKRLGHTVMAAVASGEAAVEVSRRERPDIVLMDIRLNGDLDGIEAARIIRRETNVPVVFVSAFMDDQTRRRADEIRPVAFIAKPLDEYDLHALFGRLREDAAR